MKAFNEENSGNVIMGTKIDFNVQLVTCNKIINGPLPDSTHKTAKINVMSICCNLNTSLSYLLALS